MIASSDFRKAQFTYTSSAGEQTVPVDFNPATLEYTITVAVQGEGGQAQQSASSSSAKLNLELIFDTTDTGDDVRSKTNKVELMLRTSPGEGDNPPPQVLSEVTFEWGAFKFVGVVDSYKQTMDFFSANGVPLRAVVTLSMAQPRYRFDQTGGNTRANTDQPLVLPGGNPSQLATAAGDPTAARDIASANGLESLRASASASLTLGGSITIGAAASFSAAATAGLGLGLDPSPALAINLGGTASAGIAASAGAFAGLHLESPTPTGKYFRPDKLLAATSTPGLSPNAQFDVTGRAVAQSSSGFKADVGTDKPLRFDESV